LSSLLIDNSCAVIVCSYNVEPSVALGATAWNMRETPDSKCGGKSMLRFAARILSRVSGTVDWTVEPAAADLAICEGAVRSLFNSSKDPDNFALRVLPYELTKARRERIILTFRNDLHQFYFKVFFPEFSWRYKRGLRWSPSAAGHEAAWLERARKAGVPVVDVVGAGILPWRHWSIIEPPSILVTASPLSAENLRQAAHNGGLSDTLRLSIAGMVLDYTNTLHANGVGRLDLTPENVLLDSKTGRVLLCDFEVAKPLKRWGRQRRILRDRRKTWRTLTFLLGQNGE